MSDPNRIDELLRLAYRDVRTLEPTGELIQAALAHAGATRRRGGRSRRLLLAAVATLTLSAGTALAVPQARDAIFDTFGSFKDFLAGGSTPPGSPVPLDEQPGRLNWFGGSDRASGSVIAQSGIVRLVAFRDPRGVACLGYGLAFEECRPDQNWLEELARSPVRVAVTIPEPDPSGRIALVGLTADNITTVQVRYRDGDADAPIAVSHGFVVFADPNRRPDTLTARDERGNTIVIADISEQQWAFPKVNRRRR